MKAEALTPPRYISVREVSTHFNVSTGTVWRWTRTGALPQPLRLSAGVTRWRAEDIAEFESRAIENAAKRAG